MIPYSSKGYLSPQAYQLHNHVCVIPCGGLIGNTTVQWNEDQLKPYAKYMVNGEAKDDMFQGFIFNGIQMRENHYIYPLFVGFGQPSDRKDWTLWARNLFMKSVNLNALAAAAGGLKRDVWVSLPYPHPFQKSFGFVNKRKLNFQREDDRLEAIKWWMTYFLKLWTKNDHLHEILNLRGFLWQREAIDANDEPLVKRVNEYIHSQQYLSMWLPNYGSYGVLEWDKIGFDITVANTNYTGNTSYDYNWIIHASMFSAYYHTGLQMIWGKGLIYSDQHHLDYWNLGLPENSDYMKESFLIFQFPNQRLDLLQQTDSLNYERLYSFIKGSYKKVNYPGILY